jgi:hypothetical protein
LSPYPKAFLLLLLPVILGVLLFIKLCRWVRLEAMPVRWICKTGRLEIPLTGKNAGQYDSMAVNGAATLDGVLALNFTQGYAPRRGDTFTFLAATGGVGGAFDGVVISGLASGFAYDLTDGGST